MRYIYILFFFQLTINVSGQNVDSIFNYYYSLDQILYNSVRKSETSKENKSNKNFICSEIKNIKQYKSNCGKFKFFKFEYFNLNKDSDTTYEQYIIGYNIKNEKYYRLQGFIESDFKLFFKEYKKCIFLVSNKKILQNTKIEFLNLDCLYKKYFLNEDLFCGTEKLIIGEVININGCFK